MTTRQGPPARRGRLSPDEARRRAAAEPRRRRLDADAIAEVTLHIIDTEGVDAVSMRRVAAEFDTGPASLYAHVANKDALLRMTLDKVTEDVAPLASGPWQDVLRAWAYDQRRVLAAHNDLAKVSFAHIPAGPRMVENLEALLAAMQADGVPAQVAGWSVDTVALFVTAHVYDDHLFGRVYTDEQGHPSREVAGAAFEGVGSYLATLDPAAFPAVHAHIPAMMNGDHDERFRFGLETLIAGIEKMAAEAALSREPAEGP